MIKLSNVLTIAATASLFITILPFQAPAQAYINQAMPAAPGNPAYLSQVPPGSRAVAPKPQARRLASQKPARRPAALPVSAQPATGAAYPSVGSGSTAIVRPASQDWPTVGRGTVAR